MARSTLAVPTTLVVTSSVMNSNDERIATRAAR